MRKQLKKHLGIILFLAIVGVVITSTTVSAATTTKKKAVVNIEQYKETYPGKKATGVFLFELPVLKGKSSPVKKINSSLKRMYKTELKQGRGLKGFVKQSMYKDKYISKTKSKVSYNKNGIISVRFKSDWYAGGVYNGWHHGATYDLKTGKKLKLTDVLSGNSSEIKALIANKYINKFPDLANEVRTAIYDMKLSSFDFYLKNGNVIISTGPYGPVGGNGEVPIKLKGDY